MQKKMLACALAIPLLASCGGKTYVIKTNQETEGIPVRVEIMAGKEWRSKQKMMFFNLDITPQIAVWAERPDGGYLETLYVTRAFGKQKFGFVDAKADETARPSSLPRWNAKRLEAGIAPPTKKAPLPDAITASTPKGNASLRSRLGTAERNIVVFLELNKSFDGNEAFHGKWDGTDAGFTEPVINGQPSLVFSAEVDLDAPNKNYALRYAGHGGETASDGALHPGTEGLSSALEILESAILILE